MLLKISSCRRLGVILSLLFVSLSTPYSVPAANAEPWPGIIASDQNALVRIQPFDLRVINVDSGYFITPPFYLFDVYRIDGETPNLSVDLKVADNSGDPQVEQDSVTAWTLNESLPSGRYWWWARACQTCDQEGCSSCSMNSEKVLFEVTDDGLTGETPLTQLVTAGQPQYVEVSEGQLVGLQLDIPSDALPADQQIALVIQRVTANLPGPPADREYASDGDVIFLGPEDYHFEADLTLRLPIPESLRGKTIEVWVNHAGQGWEGPLDYLLEADGTLAVVQVSEFSLYTLVEAASITPEDDPADPPGSGGGGGGGCFIGTLMGN